METAPREIRKFSCPEIIFGVNSFEEHLSLFHKNNRPNGAVSMFLNGDIDVGALAKIASDDPCNATIPRRVSPGDLSDIYKNAMLR